VARLLWPPVSRNFIVANADLFLPHVGALRKGKKGRRANYDVLADGVVVGRIFKVRVGGRTPWMWTLAFDHHADRTPTNGYEATREAAMAAFAKSWRRQ
jgi:hypothetical protein